MHEFVFEENELKFIMHSGRLSNVYEGENLSAFKKLFSIDMMFRNLMKITCRKQKTLGNMV